MTNSEGYVIKKFKSLSRIAGIVFGFFIVSLLTWLYILKLSLETAHIEVLDWALLLLPVVVIGGLVCALFL